MVQIVVPEEFPYVLLAGCILTIECFVIGGSIFGPRTRCFNKDFMAQFKDEHKKYFPDGEPSVGGWPDAGEGRYSDKLAYKDWVEFNNHMRTHQNFVESLPVILIFLIVGGMVLPQAAAIIGFVNAVTRPVYTFMYAKYGSNSRVLGAVAGSLPLYLLGMATFGRLVMSVL